MPRPAGRWAGLRGIPIRSAPGRFSPTDESREPLGTTGRAGRWAGRPKRRPPPPLSGHTESVFAVVFSPDGKTLFSGSTDQTIRAWDWRAGQVPAAWPAVDQVYSLAVSPDGQTLAAAHKG